MLRLNIYLASTIRRRQSWSMIKLRSWSRGWDKFSHNYCIIMASSHSFSSWVGLQKKRQARNLLQSDKPQSKPLHIVFNSWCCIWGAYYLCHFMHGTALCFLGFDFQRSNRKLRGVVTEFYPFRASVWVSVFKNPIWWNHGRWYHRGGRVFGDRGKWPRAKEGVMGCNRWGFF